MERRFALFLAVMFATVLGYGWLMQTLYPPKPRQPAAAKNGEEAGDKKGPKVAEKEKGKGQPEAAAKGQEKKPVEKPQKAAPVVKAAPQPVAPEQWVPIGSADANDPSRMLVWTTNRGAALARIELNSPFYCDVDHRNGYLGHLFMDRQAAGKGCRIQIVGPGTPAAEAGLQPGDLIEKFNGKTVDSPEALETLLKDTKPEQKVQIVVLRNGKQSTHEATLRRIPLEVIKPEDDDPLSMLLTLQQCDDEKLADDERAERQKWDVEDKDRKKGTDADEAKLKDERQLRLLRHELAGVDLRTANWTVVLPLKPNVAQFRYTLADKGLEITKTYRLADVPKDAQSDPNFPAYHVEFDIEIRNIDQRDSHRVAYRLDGPNGLPTEGAWYSMGRMVTRCGGIGLRDFVISMGGQTPTMEDTATIAAGKDLTVRPDTPPDKLLTFIGVDSQYFSAVLLPQRENPGKVMFDELMPIRVGKVDLKRVYMTNTSCRLVSKVDDLKPGQTMTHKFLLFAGPKKAPVLENEQYKLGELIYFGWPIYSMFAVPLTKVLHFFYLLVGNYGLAIILLTVTVRLCMFPLSLKQAAGAQKMQQLQPELKKIQEKHKGNSEARAKAQQELFRKHNYNPAAGCLPIFIQMPIFIGLYRSLMVAIELRDAPLFGHSIPWCSNLAAPDMLFNWSAWWPPAFNEGGAIYLLGPYFNLLPVLASAIMIVQMKMFTPPPADEQAATTQKMMQIMMVVMGLAFYKVASGLCLYFIVSSVWGLVERRFLPKTTPLPTVAPETRAEAKARERAAAATAANKKK